MNIFSIIVLLALAGCSPSGTDSVAGGSVGRYQFHQATEDLPAFIIDTTTGCISHVVQTEKSLKVSDWVELGTNFANWQCPPSSNKK